MIKERAEQLGCAKSANITTDFVQLSVKITRMIPQIWKAEASAVLDFVTQKLYGVDNISEKNETNIRKIAEQMGISQNFTIKQMFRGFSGKNKDIYAFTFGRHIFINEKLFERLSPEQQRFVIGHELSHLVEEHSYKRVVHATAYSALVGIDFFSLYFHRKRFKNVDSKLKKLLIVASAASVWLVNLVLKDYLLALNSVLMHNQEFEADALAVKKLKVQDGGLSFFDLLMQKRESDLSSHSHPSISERKQYIQSGDARFVESKKINVTPINRIMKLWKHQDLLSKGKDVYAIHCGIAPAVPIFIAVSPEILGVVVGGAAMLYGYIQIGSELYQIYNAKKEAEKDKIKNDGKKKPNDPKDPKKPPVTTVVKSSDKAKRSRRGAEIKPRSTASTSGSRFLKDTELGKMLKDKVIVKVNGSEKVYILKDKINNPYVKKGDIFKLDPKHENDHVKVFDARGRARCVLNLDGSINQAKTAVALADKRTIKI